MKRTITAALLLAMLSGCVLLDKWEQMSDKQKVLFVVGAYNVQYAILKSEWVHYAELSPERQKLLRWKKQVLVEVYALVQEYVALYDGSAVRSVPLEERILEVLALVINRVAPPPDFDPVLPDAAGENKELNDG